MEKGIFPDSPITLSSENFLRGFIEEQKRDINPSQAPVVDEKNREKIACLHVLRRNDYFMVNDRDRSAKEKAYVLKENIDAWTVQQELEKIGYKQSFHELAEIMDPTLEKQK